MLCYSTALSISSPAGKISRAQRYKNVANTEKREPKICPVRMKEANQNVASSMKKMFPAVSELIPEIFITPAVTIIVRLQKKT